MLDARWQAGAYLLASLGLALAASRLSGPRWRRRLAGWRTGVLRGVYLVGFPYLALIFGVVPAYRMGLTGLTRLEAIDGGTGPFPGPVQLGATLYDMANGWLPDAGALAGRVAILLAFLVVAWLGYRLFAGRRVPGAGVAVHPDCMAGPSGTPGPLAGPPSVVEAGLQVLHWSFYRAVLWLLVGDLYLAAAGGVPVVALEWAVTARWRTPLRDSLRAEEVAWRAGLLIANAVLFCSVPNLWLLIPTHWLLAMVTHRLAQSAPMLRRRDQYRG